MAKKEEKAEVGLQEAVQLEIAEDVPADVDSCI